MHLSHNVIEPAFVRSDLVIFVFRSTPLGYMASYLLNMAVRQPSRSLFAMILRSSSHTSSRCRSVSLGSGQSNPIITRGEGTPPVDDFTWNLRKALVLTKVTRYEFEKKRVPNLDEREFEKHIVQRGSDYTMIRYTIRGRSYFFREIQRRRFIHGLILR